MRFDDALLESESLADDQGLRRLASTGARIRAVAPDSGVGEIGRTERPRGFLVIGQEARLVRAVLEPVCPVPLMAWPGPGVPAWVGPLDLVAIIGDAQPVSWLVEAGAEARRRGATLIVAAPARSELTAVTQSSDAIHIDTEGSDATAAAVAMLSVLGGLGLGPRVNVDHVADAADLVAEACSPHRDLAVNPGKDLALALADRLPLIWGGSVLANRASRRFGEAIRRVDGIPALAADAPELLAVLRGVKPKDVFADPEDSLDDPVVVLLDAELADDKRLVDEVIDTADAVGVRVAHISSGDPQIATSDIERYITLLTHSLYGAEYLRIGLGKQVQR